jgi:hypothetical protein
MRNLHTRKDFLNLPFHEEDASAFSSLTRSKSYADCHLKIRDCDKYIRLELGFSGVEDLENSIYKLTTLIDHITELRANLIERGVGLVKEFEEYKKTKGAEPEYL